MQASLLTLPNASFFTLQEHVKCGTQHICLQEKALCTDPGKEDNGVVSVQPLEACEMVLSSFVTRCHCIHSVLPSLSPSESENWGGKAGFWKLSLSPYLEDFRSLDLLETFSQSSLINLISPNTLSFSILCEIQFKCVQAFHRSAGPLGGVKCGKLILFSISFCQNYGQDIN